MTVLVYADHDNAALGSATLNTVTAAAALGGDIHVLVAGAGCAAVAEEAAKVNGVARLFWLTMQFTKMRSQKMWLI